MPDLATIVRAPKALLHDHLDGGLRPATVIDLARRVRLRRPADDRRRRPRAPGSGAAPTARASSCISRPSPTRSGSCRSATRSSASPPSAPRTSPPTASSTPRSGWRPELCTERGLTLDEVDRGDPRRLPARIGERRPTAGHPIVMRSLVTAMRQAARSVEVAECAVRWRDAGVVGFDIAGPEEGYRPTRHLDAFDLVRRENFHITIHAGESFGLPSIWEALQFCGAERLGHGVRIVDDITRPRRRLGGARPAGGVRPRPAGARSRCARRSNVHTGAAAIDRASTRSTCSGGCASGSRSTPTTG